MAFNLYSANAYGAKFECDSVKGLSPYPITTNTNLHLKHAPSNTDQLRVFGGYVSSFDGSDGPAGYEFLAIPEWVSYHLKGLQPPYKEPKISIEPPNNWYKDLELSYLWENRPGIKKKRIDHSYDGVGRIWNRGHLAMADHIQRIGWQASCNTYFFRNGLPQAASLNQGPWLHLENYTAAASNKYKDLWIVTGPIFYDGQEIEWIGSAGEIPVAVPHALFKVIIRELGQGRVDALGFIFDQAYELNSKGIPEPVEKWVKCSERKKLNHVYNHSSHLVRIADIESYTGLNFFEEATNRQEVIEAKPEKLWPVEKDYWSARKCGLEYK